MGINRKIPILLLSHCLAEWTELDLEVRNVPSIAVFKKTFLSLVHPHAKSVLGICDPAGLSYLAQIRVSLSKLNFQKFLHSIRATVNPMCPTNDGIGNLKHLLLLCPSFEIQRRNFLAGVWELLRPIFPSIFVFLNWLGDKKLRFHAKPIFL